MLDDGLVISLKDLIQRALQSWGSFGGPLVDFIPNPWGMGWIFYQNNESSVFSLHWDSGHRQGTHFFAKLGCSRYDVPAGLSVHHARVVQHLPEEIKAVTDEILKFGYFQIVVQLMSVLVSL